MPNTSLKSFKMENPESMMNNINNLNNMKVHDEGGEFARSISYELDPAPKSHYHTVQSLKVSNTFNIELIQYLA